MATIAYFFLFASLLLVNMVQSNMDGCRCDSKIIKLIEKYWDEHGCPSNILDFIEIAGQLNVTKTTCGYYDEGSRCPRVAWLKEGVVFSLIKNDGTRYIESQHLKEHAPGILVEYKPDGRIVKRYVLYKSCFEMFIYKCCETATCTDTHLSLVEDYHRKESNANAVKKAEGVAERLGESLSTNYTYTSECCAF